MRSRCILRTVTDVLVLLPVLFQAVYPQCSRSDLTATETVSVTDTSQEFNTPGYRVAYFPAYTDSEAKDQPVHAQCLSRSYAVGGWSNVEVYHTDSGDCGFTYDITATQADPDIRRPHTFIYKRMDCRWIFDAGRDDVTVVFDIREMLIESSSGCSYDSITFYQGSLTTDTEIRKLCGRQYAGDYVTVSGRYALLQMKADRSRQYAGAKINYFYAQDASGSACSGTSATLTATTTTASLTSPGYPAQLANGVACQWSISSGSGTVIYLEIVYSDLSSIEGMCLEQKISIYDGSSASDPALLEEFCDGRQEFPTKPTVYYTTGNTAFVTLSTMAESFAESHGFQINYKQHGSVVTTTVAAPVTTTTEVTSVCSSSATLLQATSTWEYFRSVNYPEDYPNNANCLWQIEAPIGYTINLTFADSFLQPGDNCLLNDFINVYDGSTPEHPLLTSFCGENSPSLVSTGRYLYIQFLTDGSVVYRGFNAMYQTITAELPSCSQNGISANYTATETPAEFSSPGFPTEYNSSQTYSWLIHNPNETQVLVLSVDASSRLEGSVGCQYDSVRIYQGPCTSYPLLGQFCGTDRPTFQYDTGSYALVVMTTDETVTYSGFKLQFYLTDGVTEDSSSLVVTGIIVGSVIGSLAVLGGTAFGVVKYMEYRKRKPPGSCDTSRRSSSSSSSDGETSFTPQQSIPRRLPPIAESRGGLLK